MVARVEVDMCCMDHRMPWVRGSCLVRPGSSSSRVHIHAKLKEVLIFHNESEIRLALDQFNESLIHLKVQIA